jgi:hypothetical protein
MRLNICQDGEVEAWDGEEGDNTRQEVLVSMMDSGQEAILLEEAVDTVIIDSQVTCKKGRNNWRVAGGEKISFRKGGGEKLVAGLTSIFIYTLIMDCPGGDGYRAKIFTSFLFVFKKKFFRHNCPKKISVRANFAKCATLPSFPPLCGGGVWI